MVNNVPYVLIRQMLNSKKDISFNDILYFQNFSINYMKSVGKFRNDWIELWKRKLDYYEELLGNCCLEYKEITESIDFYIGLGENAICYLVNNTNKNIISDYISHKRVNLSKGVVDFYNPLNYIVDTRVRDFSEYIKELYFYHDISFEFIKKCLDYTYYTKDEYILLISRLLFPSYYFDCCDEIITENKNKNKLKMIIKKSDNYIELIKKIFFYVIYNKFIELPYIEWIIKKAD